MRCTLLGVFSICLLVCAACGDKSVDPDTFTLPLTAFPHSIGDSWTYAVTLSSFDGAVDYDTVVVTIVDSIAYDCGQLDCAGTFEQIWQLEYTGRLDTMTVLYLHDSLHMNHPKGWFSLYFPLALNKTWSDSCTIGAVFSQSGVLEVMNRLIGNTPVAHCMTVWERLSYGDGIEFDRTIIVAPRIGLAAISVEYCKGIDPDTLGIIHAWETWELIDWDVD